MQIKPIARSSELSSARRSDLSAQQRLIILHSDKGCLPHSGVVSEAIAYTLRQIGMIAKINAGRPGGTRLKIIRLLLYNFFAKALSHAG